MTQDSEVRQFSTELLIDTITETVLQHYYSYPKIQAMYSVDDMIQENILYFYKPMRSGEQRLEHYLNNYSVPEVLSIIRMATRQSFNELLRYNHVKYNPSSLNAPISNSQDDSNELIDLVKDTSESIDLSIECQDLYDAIIQCSDMYTNKNYSTAELIRDHLAIMKDLMNGYKKSELRIKYKDFDIKLKHVQEIIKSFYNSRGTSLNSILGIQENTSRSL